MFGLQIVEGVSSDGCCLLVGIVQLVPIDLAVCFRCRPEVICRRPVGKRLVCPVIVIGLIPYVEVAARQCLPVVGMWISALL